MAVHFYTLNGCYFTEPSIFPADWKTGGSKLLQKDWRIQYYFYDPNYANKKPYGKLCVVKGMNEYKNLKQRREALKVILDDELYQLNKGYNPFTGEYMVDSSIKYGILHSKLKFIDAFRIALTKVKGSKDHIYQIKCAINRVEQSAIKLKLDRTTIYDLKRSNLKSLLDQCNLTPNYFNKFKSYLSTLFVELVEYECCETNLTRDIRKQKTVKNIREVLNPEDYKTVMNYLRVHTYSFYRYCQIFMYSGARSTELLNLTPELVDLANQEFTVIIKKGNRYIETTKVILKPAVPFWEEILELSGPNEFLFSKGLVPGAFKNNSKQITRRWHRHIKSNDSFTDSRGNTIKITADFYALKHSLLDSLPTEIAQQMASHTNFRTTEIYQVHKKKRERELLKNIKISI